MSRTFRPMLASPADLDKLEYPLYLSPKLDGIRASNVDGRLLSRTLKEIPSRHVYNMFNQSKFKFLDGELIVGDPTSPTCYRDTVSGVMSEDKEPDFKWHVFDYWAYPTVPFSERVQRTQVKIIELNHPHIVQVEHTVIHNREELDAYEASHVLAGYEGVMVNSATGFYKFGRATPKGGELLKVKRYTDAESTVLGVVEEEHNANEAETNELGRTKRSSAQAGKSGKGTMGALHVRDNISGVEFHIGTGFTAADRVALWTNPPIGKVVKYKHFPVGAKDRPRHPVFLGFRPEGA